MSRVYEADVPAWSALTTFADVDFRHACALDLPPESAVSAVQWAELMFREPPRTLQTLMRTRDLMVRPLGLKPVIARSDRPTIGPFPMLTHNDREVVFGIDDRHLDFRSAILLEEVAGVPRVVCATLARAHSALGRSYLTPIRVAHPLLTALLLRRAGKAYLTHYLPSSSPKETS